MEELENIKLFKRLKKLDEDFASQLKKTANSIKELINKKTTINFPNYTNHDMSHSFKLMDTIFELIEDNKKDFNALEIALMIYSSLFHDIGMAISDEEIKKIKNNNSKYLYEQDFNEIVKNNFDNEDLALQEIIRVSHGKIAYDLITTKYEKEFRLPKYESISFAQNLAEICLSHTMDKSYVESLETNTIKGEYEYNTQFLSILLRLADILDIDSTRTPLALYEAIDLNNFSKSEWQKNFTIDNIKKIFKSNDLKEIKLEGSCKDIKVHRKLLNYIKWIENELRLAVDLTANMPKKYHIKLNTEVKNNIKPIGYDIPDLKLNMDYNAVTNLLMGEAIYGSKDLGLRELLQNSIDAIMVKKDMFEIKNMPQKGTYEPTINIDIDEENNKLIIQDNGMGMNKYIIKNYFLNVGKSYYKSKDFLNYKHNYNPIGNFGIGFLSCFMLSNEVQVITKHFNSNKKYTIDLEKNSEYIAFKEDEDNSSESGTKIILNTYSLNKIFKLNNKETLENAICKFIYTFINIDSFSIKLNKERIHTMHNFNDDRFFEHSINLEDYLKDIKGKIYIKQNDYNETKIQEDINYAFATYYCKKGKIEKINDLKDLNLENIIQENNIEYCKIPLIKSYQDNEKIEALLDARSWDLKEIIEYSYLDEFICIFWDKEYQISLDDETMEIDDFSIESDEEYIDFDEIKENFRELDSYFIPLAILENENIFFQKNNYLMKYIERRERSSPYFSITDSSVFIKNIRLDHYLNIKLSNYISITKFLININNNDLFSNISRKELTENSQNTLNYAISKIIYSYVLENFELKSHEKELLKKLIDKFYFKKNILFK